MDFVIFDDPLPAYFSTCVTFLKKFHYKPMNDRQLPEDTIEEKMMKWNRIRIFSVLLMTGLVCVIAQAASLKRTDIPVGNNWYVHVNLDLIQNSEVGRQLMLETVDEALDDIEGELEISIRHEIQGITVFGVSLPVDRNPVKEGAVILHGSISPETQNALLSTLERKGAEVSAVDSAGLAYYRIENGDGTMTYSDEEGQVNVESWNHQEELYFSFGPTQTMITQSQEMIQGFLDTGGYIGGLEAVNSEALLILEADRALLQGGANTSDGIGEHWDSSVLKNVDAVALVVAEDLGGLQINAQLTANSADVAMSVRNIVEGLVALKALDESEGVLGDILRQVRFENDGSVLRIDVPVAADQIEAIRDHL